MSPDDADPLDEQFSALLVAYHEGLAAGRAPDPDPPSTPLPLLAPPPAQPASSATPSSSPESARLKPAV